MTEVVEKAYKLVDDSLITEADFRDFVFANPQLASTPKRTRISLFKGTAVDGAVDTLLSLSKRKCTHG